MLRRSALLGVALGLVAPLVGQTAKLKDALPANTIVYFAAPDIRSSLEEMQGMPLVQMWKEAEVQDFFADALKMGEAWWQQQLEKGKQAHEMGMLPFSPDELMKLRVDGLGFAVTSLDLTKGDHEPMPKIGVVLQLDFGDSAPVWRSILDYGVQMAETQGAGMLTKKTTKIGDIELITFVPPETEMSLNVAFTGKGVILGTVQSDVAGVLERMQSGKAALSATDAFAKTFTNLDTQGAELECFIQPGQLFDFALRALQVIADENPDFPPEIDIAGIGRALDALGLRSIVAAGSTSSYVAGEHGSHCVTKGYTLSPAPTRKGVFAGANKSVDMSFLRWVPKDAASFSAGTFDLAAIYNGIVNALKAYDKEKADQVLGLLSLYEQQFGVSVKDDLVGSFGHQHYSWSMPVAALGTTPEMAILVAVKDKDRLLKMLKKASELSDGAFELDESERRGITVYQIQFNFDLGQRMGGFNPFEMFIPTFSFKDGYLVAGFSTGDVKRTFKRMEREDDPAGDIRSNPEFKPYLAKLPQGNLSSVSFSDWKANFEGMYQLATSVLAFVPFDKDIPIELSLLPDVQTLTQHLYGSVSWCTSDGNGYRTMSSGPWGPETVALFGGAVAAGAGFMAARGGIARRIR